MGIFSEIVEEMEEKAYYCGFWRGVFWPVTLPCLGAAWAYLELSFWWRRRRWARREEPYYNRVQADLSILVDTGPHLKSYAQHRPEKFEALGHLHAVDFDLEPINEP